MKTWIVREWPAPAYNRASARKHNVGESARIQVNAATRAEAREIAVKQHELGIGRALTIVRG